MTNGYLSQYFESVAVKTLRAVEVDSAKSNQHEFNGTRELKQVIRTTDTAQFETKFIWMEEENETLVSDSTVSWYDSRKNQPKRSPEYRLYFIDNPVIRMAKEGDTMFIARRTDNTLLIVITPPHSTIERQLYWLFNLTPPQGDLFSLSEIDSTKIEVDFSARFILEELGIEVEEPENEILDRLVSKFVGGFPSMAEFSLFSRETFTEKVSIVEDPDSALVAYMNWEEKLFRRLERNNVAIRLKEGFANDGKEDVEGFIHYSLSVQNRRKSRAGSALEEHLNFIFNESRLLFSKEKVTENKSKPDFLFPDISLYHNADFPIELLTMLGAKTSLKDRWRQVLSEAKKISHKHLLTLEPGISENQTNEMRDQYLALVIPKEIQQTYTPNQQGWLISLKDFINSVSKNQKQAIEYGFIKV